MPMDRPGGPCVYGPHTAIATRAAIAPHTAIANIARRVMAPLAALCVVAGLTAACGSASTPLEVYQNCLRCGYDFKQPIPTAAAALNRARSGYGSRQADTTLAVFSRDDES